MDRLIEIKTLEDYEKAILKRSILMFTADWCPDCVFIKPYMTSIVENHPDFTFYVVNRDDMLDLCKDLKILGIPSFVAYEQGEEIGRFVSKFRKTKEEVEAFISTLK